MISVLTVSSGNPSAKVPFFQSSRLVVIVGSFSTMAGPFLHFSSCIDGKEVRQRVTQLCKFLLLLHSS